jgi:hypothetical protein
MDQPEPVLGPAEPDPGDLAGVHVEDRGQVQPAFCGGDVGEVGEPDLVRMRGLKVTGGPVWGDQIAMTAVGGSGATGQRRQSAKTGAAHQPLDP